MTEGCDWHGIEFLLSVGIVNKVCPGFIYSFLPKVLFVSIFNSTELEEIRFDCLGKYFSWSYGLSNIVDYI